MPEHEGDPMHTETPAEEDLPAIISVDDHVMEPKTLWQEQLPPSLRARGPRVSRERVRLEFKGGHYGFERGVDKNVARDEQTEALRGFDASRLLHARDERARPGSTRHAVDGWCFSSCSSTRRISSVESTVAGSSAAVAMVGGARSASSVAEARLHCRYRCGGDGLAAGRGKLHMYKSDNEQALITRGLR